MNDLTDNDRQSDNLSDLIGELENLLQRIAALGNGELDAVLTSSGPHLLQEAQHALLRNEALHRQFAHLRGQILDALPAHIALLDESGRVLTVNEAWRRFAQANHLPDANFAIGTNYLEVCEAAQGEFSEEAGATAAGIRRVLGGESNVFALEYPCHSPDQKRWFRLMVTPLENDSRSGAVVMHVDITERMLAQESLRKQEEKLQQAQRMESLGRLTGGIAHDFNNLLTVIIGTAEALIDLLGDSEDGHAMASMIQDAAGRAAELTRRLLAFGRRQALEPRPIDLNKLLLENEFLLKRTLGADVNLKFVKQDGLWLTLADPSHLENALINLCANARDAMPDGGQLTIETANACLDWDYSDSAWEVKEGEYVMVAVSDSGMGIEPALLERVFEPFFTTKESGHGSGLGLSMVYGFVKQSQGHIMLYSEIGHGTTVKIFLPRSLEAEHLKPVPKPFDRASTAGSELILVVEDEELVLTLAENILRSLGYRVLVARNGADALQILGQRDDIDLLFTDVVLPGGMNGRQLANEATALRPGLKVLFASGYTDNALVHQGRLEMGVKLLSKPYRRDELARRIREVLGESRP